METTAWLIEGPLESAGQSYVGVVGGPHKNFAFVYDADRALHFSRQEDAQACIDSVPWFRSRAPLKACEHIWPSRR